jgi:hypothetical protein
VPLVHHELCFGCGRVNLFGLLLEVQEVAPGAVAGRCFVKQDHQGADRRRAHDGVTSNDTARASRPQASARHRHGHRRSAVGGPVAG